MKKRIIGVAVVIGFLGGCHAIAQTLQQASRPRVWWHWMNGNITKEGIRKDLLWMKRAGIGGFQVFDAGMAIPQVVGQRLTYMSPEWKDAFAYATHLADSLGLEMAISSSPGWSLMGGPWVAPTDGMKKLTWRETVVTGNGKPQRIALPKPFTTTGPFQNMPLQPNVLLGETLPEHLPALYRDTKVLAYPVPDSELSLADPAVGASCGKGAASIATLTDGDLCTAADLPIDPATGKATLDIVLKKPQTFRSVQISDGRVRPEFDAVAPDYPYTLYVLDEKGNARKIAKIPAGGAALQTVDIPATKGCHFRIEIAPEAVNPYLVMMGKAQQPTVVHLSEFNLFTASHVNHAEEKAGFMATHDMEQFPTAVTTERFPGIGQVIDLTDKVDAGGTLRWVVPKGHWRIIRFGWSLTGSRNHPASPEATGLEIDKLDKQAWQRYFTTYLDMYREASGGLMGKRGIQYLLTDSYESGATTWTPGIMDEFRKRRGYDLTPWMPAFAGHILGTADETERFLWDWRKTIAELQAENYDQLTAIVTKQYGMKGRYTESHEHGRLMLADGMDVKRTSAVPMSAIWAKSAVQQPGYDDAMAAADIRESASVAHIYGQNVVAAESFTVVGYPNNAWTFSPETLKPYADFSFANGLNRIVVHTSPHQPVDSLVPGLSLSATGQWFDRHETWAEQAGAWTDYLARTSALLQKGHFSADILYYYGEGNCISALYGHQRPDIPVGYDFDYASPDVLLRQVQADGGCLVTRSGMSYRVLALGRNTRRMSLPVLRKLAALVDAGVLIYGEQPTLMASLADSREEFDRLVRHIWHSGKPNVYVSGTLADVLHGNGIQADLTYKTADNRQLRYLHRSDKDGEIYWISNPENRPVTAHVSLRCAGYKPFVYQPVDGTTRPADYRIENGRTVVTLGMQPNDALFILLTEKSSDTQFASPKQKTDTLVSQFSAWQISFQQHRGAPDSVSCASLKSLSEFSEAGIKYFSGTATYRSTFTLSKKQLKRHRSVLIDLGVVKNIAEVYVNGHRVSTLWKAPFCADIAPWVKKGSNTLEVRVINLWANRLIGDAQPGVKNRITYTSLPFYQPNAPLPASGLIGPVTVVGQ